MQKLERLQKILSMRGIASRRKAEEYIEAGLVKVNGKVVKLGDKANPEKDKIEVHGKVIADRKEMLYFVMNKPVGILSENLPSEPSVKKDSSKPKSNVLIRDNKVSHGGSKTVHDLLPPKLRGKVFPVGRLDKDSSGLLLFTNDGVLAYRLTHPKFEHDKEYEIILDRPFSPDASQKMEKGFVLDGTMTKPLTLEKITPNCVRIILTEGRNRQIRRMCQNVGYTVKELKRVRIMTLEDAKLKVGTIRALTEAEKLALLQSVGV